MQFVWLSPQIWPSPHWHASIFFILIMRLGMLISPSSTQNWWLGERSALIAFTHADALAYLWTVNFPNICVNGILNWISTVDISQEALVRLKLSTAKYPRCLWFRVKATDRCRSDQTERDGACLPLRWNHWCPHRSREQQDPLSKYIYRRSCCTHGARACN